MPQNAKTRWSQKGWCNKPIKLKFQSILNTENISMLSKNADESAGIDRRTWLHVPSGTVWSTSSYTHQVVEIPKDTSNQMYTPF